jgi:hypothetical protein
VYPIRVPAYLKDFIVLLYNDCWLSQFHEPISQSLFIFAKSISHKSLNQTSKFLTMILPLIKEIKKMGVLSIKKLFYILCTTREPNPTQPINNQIGSVRI